MNRKREDFSADAARQHARFYLERQLGYEVLDSRIDGEGSRIHLVAKDPERGHLVFATARWRTVEEAEAEVGREIEGGADERTAAEARAARWLSARDDAPDAQIRFDDMVLTVTGSRRVLVRHVLSCWD